MLRREEKKRKDGKKPARRTIEGMGAATLGLAEHDRDRSSRNLQRDGASSRSRRHKDGRASKSMSVVVVGLEPSAFLGLDW